MPLMLGGYGAYGSQVGMPPWMQYYPQSQMPPQMPQWLGQLYQNNPYMQRIMNMMQGMPQQAPQAATEGTGQIRPLWQSLQMNSYQPSPIMSQSQPQPLGTLGALLRPQSQVQPLGSLGSLLR